MDDAMLLREFIKHLDETIKQFEMDVYINGDLVIYDLGFEAMEAGQGDIDSGNADKLFTIADNFDTMSKQDIIDKLKEIGKEYDI